MSIMSLLEKQVKDPTRITTLPWGARNETQFQNASVAHMEEQIYRRCRTIDLYDSEVHYGLSQGRHSEQQRNGSINRGVWPPASTRK